MRTDGRKKESDIYFRTYEAPNAKILVVDDNEMNRKVFCNLLKDTKMQIEQAESGKKCLELVKEIAFDIIFMDHMMPEMDGIETFHAMEKLEGCLCRETPVVILTANAIVGAKEQYLKEGFSNFLTKPIDTQMLDNIIKELLDEKLVHYIDKQVREKSETCALDVSELPVIEGLDWGYAVVHHKDTESMLDMVQMFYKSIEYEALELEKHYEVLKSDEGLKNYRIKVHSMKSTAAMVGIIPLAGMAKVLEDAARNSERNAIENMHSIFLKLWRDYKEHLEIFAEKNEDLENATEHQAEINELLRSIKEAAGVMDIDAMDAAMRNLKQYQFDEKTQSKIQEIEVGVANLDVEFLENII